MKLITGASGFIGRHLCKQFEEVIKLDKVTGFDITSQHFMEEWDVDEIYNLACPASPIQYQLNPIETIKTNVIGSLRVLEFAALKKAKVFQASTSEVYGDPQVCPQSENYYGHVNPIGNRSCYDEGKRCAEALFTCFHNVRIARIFNTYGPGMRYDDGRVIPQFFFQARNNLPLTVYGDGEQVRCFCYIDDLIEGIVLLMKSSIESPVNLGNPVRTTIIELAEKIIKLTNSRSKIFHLPLPKDDPINRQPDITKARSLGWEPKTSLEEGLWRTYSTLKHS